MNHHSYPVIKLLSTIFIVERYFLFPPVSSEKEVRFPSKHRATGVALLFSLSYLRRFEIKNAFLVLFEKFLIR